MRGIDLNEVADTMSDEDESRIPSPLSKDATANTDAKTPCIGGCVENSPNRRGEPPGSPKPPTTVPDDEQQKAMPRCSTRGTDLNNLRVSKRRRQEVRGNPREGAESHITCQEVASLNAQRILVFSGSGMSAASGMSTFSKPGGLYEKARKKYGLNDGMRLFHYSFFQKRRADCQAFLTGVWAETVQAKPTKSHQGLVTLARQGRLLRHYTMNIDGLHSEVGPRWDPALNPTGLNVEMHGNVTEAVCEECAAVYPMAGAASRSFRARRAMICTAMRSCRGELRPRIMFYNDDDESLIIEDFDELLEKDLESADLILWIGISFEQSASVEHFRRVRRLATKTTGTSGTMNVVINPDDDPLWNLKTGMSNVNDLNLKQINAKSDDVLPAIAKNVPDSSNQNKSSKSSADS